MVHYFGLPCSRQPSIRIFPNGAVDGSRAGSVPSDWNAKPLGSFFRSSLGYPFDGLLSIQLGDDWAADSVPTTASTSGATGGSSARTIGHEDLRQPADAVISESFRESKRSCECHSQQQLDVSCAPEFRRRLRPFGSGKAEVQGSSSTSEARASDQELAPGRNRGRGTRSIHW